VPGHHADVTGCWKQDGIGSKYQVRPDAAELEPFVAQALQRGGFKKDDPTAKHRSWTFFTEEHYAQETSGQCHILGVIFCLVTRWHCTKANRARDNKALFGWSVKLEPPFARPRADVKGDAGRPGRQPSKHGQTWSAGAKWKAQTKAWQEQKKLKSVPEETSLPADPEATASTGQSQDWQHPGQQAEGSWWGHGAAVWGSSPWQWPACWHQDAYYYQAYGYVNQQ
jgi:hypothetical protein